MIFSNTHKNNFFLKAILLIILSANIFSFYVPITHGEESQAEINIRQLTRLSAERDALLVELSNANTPEERGPIIDRIEQYDRVIQRLQEQVNADAITASEPIKKQNSYISCGGSDIFSLSCHLANLSYQIVFVPSAALMVASGRLFDWVMITTVVDMKATLFGRYREHGAIEAAWAVIRDYFNVLFIFVLLWISIKTIFNGASNTGKEIIKVIIVAMLINFSLLFTKAFIDVGNILSISMYNEATTNTSISSGGNSYDCKISSRVNDVLPGAGLGGNDNSISCAIIASTGVASTISSANGQGLDYSEIILKSLGGSVLMVILAIILFTVSFMLISRIIVLAFVLFTSAAAFGGYMLPQLKTMITDPWKKALIGQTFFPFVLLLMLGISLKLMRALTSPGNWNNLSAGILPQVVFSYAMIIGLLIASITVAKKVSDSSGAMAGKITGFAKNAVTGGAIKAARFSAAGTGFAGRVSVGAAAKRFADNRSGDSAISRGLMRGGNWLASRSYDVRNLPGAKNTLGKIDKNLGKGGGQGGFNKMSSNWDESAKKKLDAKEKMYGKLSLGEQRQKEKIESEIAKNKVVKSEAQKEVNNKNDSITKAEQLLSEKKILPGSSAEEIAAIEKEIAELKKARETAEVTLKEAEKVMVKTQTGFMGRGKKQEMTLSEAQKLVSDINNKPKDRSKAFVARMDTGNFLTTQINPRTRKWAKRRRAESSVVKSNEEIAQEKMLKAIENIAKQNSASKQE